MSVQLVFKQKLIYNHIMTKLTLLIGTASNKYYLTIITYYTFMLVYIQNYTTRIRIEGRNILFSEHFCELLWQRHTHAQMLHNGVL
jgi:hypothetical protein